MIRRADRGTRGVSEAVGFLLVFSIIMGVSISAAVFGIESLENASDPDSIHAASSSLALLRSDMYDLADGASYRSTELDLADGALRYGDPIRITVEATSSSGSMESITVRPQPIVYDLGRIELISIAGAILLVQEHGGVMKIEPMIRIDDQRMILPLLNTSHEDGPTSVGIGGEGIAYVVGYRWETDVRQYEPLDADGDPVTATVTVTMETPRARSWQQYFEDHPRFQNVVVDDDGDQVSAQIVTKRVYVSVVHVHVRFAV